MHAGWLFRHLLILLLGLAGGCEARFAGQGTGQVAGGAPVMLLPMAPSSALETARMPMRAAAQRRLATASADTPPTWALRGTIHDVSAISEFVWLMAPGRLRGSFVEVSGS